MKLNLAIRTILVEQSHVDTLGNDSPRRAAGVGLVEKGSPISRADFSVGGGIVADSDPADEYDETLAKARAMLAALGSSPPPSSVRSGFPGHTPIRTRGA